MHHPILKINPTETTLLPIHGVSEHTPVPRSVQASASRLRRREGDQGFSSSPNQPPPPEPLAQSAPVSCPRLGDIRHALARSRFHARDRPRARAHTPRPPPLDFSSSPVLPVSCSVPRRRVRAGETEI
ncbi:hypothetical protein JHW43_008966 [Diplocarpon mali]|nr:hypothetical protein JHW43_008966 [Diplocarpon mali]